MSKRYPGYKNSGVEWLGDVPEHWDVSLAKRFITVKSGDMISANDETEEGFPIIGGNGFRAFTNRWNTPRDTLVIGRVGALCGCVHHIDRDFWASEHAYRVIEKEKLSKRFFYHLLSAVNLNQFAIKTAQPLLNTEIVETRWVSVPPLDEQVAIAAFLDHETAKIDALVEEQRRLIELLKEKRQAVISHAVTRGLNPNAPMKDSGIEWLGEVPKHWEIKRLKFVAQVRGGIAKGRNIGERDLIEVPYLRVANVQDGYLDLAEIAQINISTEELDRYSLQAGDVLMNEGGDFDKLGRGHVWQAEITPCVHQNHVFAVRPTGIESNWLNLLTSSAYGRFYLMSRSKQSTNLASISSTNVGEFPLPCPPALEQMTIVEYVHSSNVQLDKLAAQANAAISLLQERRTALISAAVTGKIDVRDFAAKETEAA